MRVFTSKKHLRIHKERSFQSIDQDNIMGIKQECIGSDIKWITLTIIV